MEPKQHIKDNGVACTSIKTQKVIPTKSLQPLISFPRSSHIYFKSVCFALLSEVLWFFFFLLFLQHSSRSVCKLAGCSSAFINEFRPQLLSFKRTVWKKKTGAWSGARIKGVFGLIIKKIAACCSAICSRLLSAAAPHHTHTHAQRKKQQQLCSSFTIKQRRC